jgi:hypothetical protein
MKIIFYLVISLAFLLVTFFGLGPVLMADGTTTERMLTLLVVVLIYLALGWIFKRFKNSF